MSLTIEEKQTFSVKSHKILNLVFLVSLVFLLPILFPSYRETELASLTSYSIIYKRGSRGAARAAKITVMECIVITEIPY